MLITGAAGFIGHALGIRLAEAGAVGIDSFTDYYDVALKADRAAALMDAGAEVHKMDMCDRAALGALFRSTTSPRS